MSNIRQTEQSVVFVSKTQETLMSPQRKVNKKDSGYSILAINIPLFYSLHQMPIDLDPGRLDDRDGVEETLRKNDAQYHHSCRLLFNNSNLERAQKRASSSDCEASSSTSKLPRKRL